MTRSYSQWVDDHSIPLPFRVNSFNYDNKEYVANGMSRGTYQQVITVFHKKDETFFISSNIVPQYLIMNRCEWYILEKGY